MKRLCLAALLLFFAALSLSAQRVTLIEHARIFDGTGAPAYVGEVLIENSRIAAIGAHVEAPANAEHIDAAGKTLLPGFFDVHTHLTASAGAFTADWQKNAAAYLVCGVTTIDDFSSTRDSYAALRKLIAEGIYQTPHINFALRMSTPGGHGAEGGAGDRTTVEVNTAASAHEAMKRVLPYKPDVIKIFTDGWRYNSIPDLSSMNTDTIHAIVEDAHRAGIKTLTHTVTVEGGKVAAKGGVDVIAHSMQDKPADPELIALMKAQKTFYAPTLAVYEPNRPIALTPLVLAAADPRLKDAMEEAIASKKLHDTSRNAIAHWKLAQANLRALYAAGIPVAVGTDNGMTFTPHGWGTLHEMELLVNSGLTPAQALQAGTRVSAQALGLLSERGTLEKGKLADMVLIDGHPDETIADVEKIDAVWLAGKKIDRAKLIAEIASAQPMPIPAVTVPALLDNMEQADGGTSIGTMKYTTTDPGADHSHALGQQVARPDGGHAWLLTAHFGPKEKNYARLNLPLTPGEVTLANLSGYHGILFEAKGEGIFTLSLDTLHGRARRFSAQPFAMQPNWKQIKIPFSALTNAQQDSADTKNARALLFELSGAAGTSAWLEVGRVALY